MLVEILLPLYNPNNYVYEQLQSINNQTFKSLKLTVRDDGSTSSKIDLNKVNIKIPYTYSEGSNLGVVNSFLTLLRESDNTSEFYAFSDQDDVWLENKIERGIQHLKAEKADLPLMYCANVNVVNQDLEHLGYLAARNKGPSFNNAMLQNIATGCTIILNKKARDLINSIHPNTDKIVMHDWWVYLIVSAFGKVIYDHEPVLLYRQHDSNTYGSGYGTFQRWIVRMKRFKKNKEFGSSHDQLCEFYKHFGEKLTPEYKKIMKNYFNSRDTFTNRVKFSISQQVFRQNTLENIAVHILLVSNKF